MPRPLYKIAEDIAADWENPHYTAVSYLNAMGSLSSLEDRFGADDGEAIVLYFLSNAGKWRGPVAKSIKKELRGMLKNQRRMASPVRVALAYLGKVQDHG
jgi:hypothetical protein